MAVCVHMEVLLGWRTCVGVPVGVQPVIVSAVSCACVCVCLYEVTCCVGPTLAYLLKADGNSDTWPKVCDP